MTTYRIKAKICFLPDSQENIVKYYVQKHIIWFLWWTLTEHCTKLGAELVLKELESANP